MALSDSPMLQSLEMRTRFKILRSVNDALEKMSVKEICENAGVSRDTFYRYFNSKYDIAVWHGKLVQSIYLDQVGRTMDWETGYFHNLRLLAEEKDFYLHAFRETGRKLKDFPEMEQHRAQVIRQTLEEWRNVELDDEMEFCIQSFALLETVLITKWLRGGCQPGPSIQAKRMADMVPHLLWHATKL